MPAEPKRVPRHFLSYLRRPVPLASHFSALKTAKRSPHRLPTLALLATCLLVSHTAPAATVGSNPSPANTEPLTLTPGNAARGRDIVASRQQGLCLLCHSAPIAEERFQGDLAPNLAGVGGRLTAAQLRARMVDSRRLNPDSIMPAYFRSTELTRVGASWQSRTLLDAQQIEDVVAWLVTLK